MAQKLQHVRHGMGSVRPYIHGHLDVWELVSEVFDAVLIERHEFSPTSFHIEAQIGDSVLVLETGDPPSPDGFPGSIYVYVPDVDAAYQRAIRLGVESLAEPVDKPYDERQAGFKDSFGNLWWISTFVGK
ncbi:MAG: VOC family protein [Rhodothermales bacterium]|nr:VOC family protein [Rhodothermales bacterium]